MSSILTSEFLDEQQQLGYNKVVAENGGIVWMHVGDGKTRVGLLGSREIAWDFPVIVAITRRVAFHDWKEEIATLQLEHEIYELENVAPTKVFEKKTIILVSEGMVVTHFFDHFMRQYQHEIGCLIVDEGYLYKNPSSDRHKAVKPFAETIPTIVLSGSIMTARDIVDIYGQVAIAGRGKVLAPTLTKFRTKFQVGIQGAFFSWHPKPTAYKDIMTLIEPFTHIHLPDVSHVKPVTRIYKVLPTDQQRAFIKELKETAAIEGKFELNQMSNIIIKAQQISNGWIKHDDGTYENIASNKIERCIALIEELLQTNYKVVIWCAFRYDIIRLSAAFNKAGIKDDQFTLWWSGTSFNFEKWATKKCRICIATEAIGSSVNFFGQVPYAIYFSQDFKYHSLEQSKGRHTRRSSMHDTAYFLFLHTEKTMDSQVYWTVQSSRKSEKHVVQAMEVVKWLKTQ